MAVQYVEVISVDPTSPEARRWVVPVRSPESPEARTQPGDMDITTFTR